MSTFKGYVVTAPDGKSYDVNAPEGTSEEELYSYVQQTYYPTTAVAGEVNKSEAIIGNQDSVLPTKALEEVPGAREFLDAEWRKGTQFNDAADLYYKQFGDNVPKLAPDAAKSWAENRAFAQTPEGKKYFETNSPIGPVNRATGVADPTAPDSMAEEFGVAAKKSLANMANTVTGFAGLAADVVGAEETSEALLDTYLEKQAAIEQNYLFYGREEASERRGLGLHVDAHRFLRECPRGHGADAGDQGRRSPRVNRVAKPLREREVAADRRW